MKNQSEDRDGAQYAVTQLSLHETPGLAGSQSPAARFFRIRRRSYWICACLAALIFLKAAVAEVFFQADFSEGDLESGNLPLTKGGEIVVPPAGTPGLEVKAENPFSPKGGAYLSAKIEAGTPGPATIQTMSDGSDPQWDSWVTPGDATTPWLINLAYDFYFRTDQELGESNRLTPIYGFNKDPFWTLLTSNGEGISVLIGCGKEESLTSTDSNGTVRAGARIFSPGEFRVEPNTVYHFAVSIQTDPKTGAGTARLFAKSGEEALREPIKNSSDSPDLIGETSFEINGSKVIEKNEGDAKKSLRLGITQPIRIGEPSGRQDFDQIRIYNSAPESFAPLP